jgi:uncharacterized protein YbaR (Trm112 family)
VHLLVTDRLTCPRCGPGFGLILLANRTTGDRRVLDGELGCSNCRDRFPVRDGFGDLRAPPRRELPEGRAAGLEPEAAESERLQALLGIPGGPGMVALVGAPAAHAPALARLMEGVEILAVDPAAAGWEETAGITRLAARPGLPIFPGTLRGVVVDGGLGPRWVAEGVRVLAPRARLVLVHAGEDGPDVVEEAGLQVLASEAGTVVAARS